MRGRELIFGAIAIALLATSASFGSQLYASVGPTVAATPMPTVPRTELPAPKVPGTLAFAIQGDVFVIRDGLMNHQTAEGRNQQPALSSDGRVVLFARRGLIDGRSRLATGQIVNAQLGFSDIVSKSSSGGQETLLVPGLRARNNASGFHEVSWYLSPALSPDGRRISFIEDDGGGAADLVVMDLGTRHRLILSQGSDLADAAWSPDGRSIVTTSYNTDTPGFVIWAADRTGSGQRLTKLPEGEAYRASYSPDGKSLVYTLRVGARNDVHVVEIASGRDIALTTDGKSWNGVMSPDGRWVAFLREQGGVIDLYAMELADALTGGAAKPALKLTKGQGIDGASRPAWAQ